NSYVTSEHKLVGKLEPYGCLLLTSTRIDRSQIQIEPIEHGVAVSRFAFFDDFAVELLHQKHGRAARENVSRRELLSRRTSSNQRDDFFLRQRRFTGEKRPWWKQRSIEINANGVIADDGCAVQIDRRIRRIARIERKRPTRNVEPAERQCCFNVFHLHHTLQTRLKSSPSQFQISRRFAGGEITTNEHRIFGF